ncbi:MAG: PKD domain-containing protein [Bacteroidota bacterium]
MRNILKTGVIFTMVSLLLWSCEPQELDDRELGSLPQEEQLSFSVTPESDQPNVISFENTSELPGVVTWKFGNGTTGQGQTASAEYPFADSYEVTMTLATEGGHATTTKTIEVEEDDLSLLENPLYTALTGGADNEGGKTWVFDQYHEGHFGVGPGVGHEDHSMSADWWEAGPNDKLESALYDNTFTFKQVGVELIWENNGWIYTNEAGKDDLAEQGYTNSEEPPAEDFNVEYAPNDSYNFNLNTSDSTLTLTDGAFLGHYAGTSEYKILSISEDEMYLRAQSTVNEAEAWYYRLVPEDENVEPVIPLKAEPLSEDFEEDQPSVVFEKEAMGERTDSSYQNPAPFDGNTSDNVFLYEKPEGEDGFYSNISYLAEGYKFDLSTQNKITMQVYMPSYNDYTTEYEVAGEWITNNQLQSSVAVKFQNSEMGDMAYETQEEILKTDIETGTWVELTFDFSHASDREDFNKIVIQFGREGHAGGGIFFFDNFEFHE